MFVAGWSEGWAVKGEAPNWTIKLSVPFMDVIRETQNNLQSGSAVNFGQERGLPGR